MQTALDAGRRFTEAAGESYMSAGAARAIPKIAGKLQRSLTSRFGMLAGTHGLPDLGRHREPAA